ncbi:MAG: hypothetical protein JRK53_10455 [Deltaproteobacteria bacterium]|nr:hypothetical protein [Deltaproteobacteria bacterium]
MALHPETAKFKIPAAAAIARISALNHPARRVMMAMQIPIMMSVMAQEYVLEQSPQAHAVLALIFAMELEGIAR